MYRSRCAYADKQVRTPLQTEIVPLQQCQMLRKYSLSTRINTAKNETRKTQMKGGDKGVETLRDVDIYDMTIMLDQACLGTTVKVTDHTLNPNTNDSRFSKPRRSTKR